MRILKFLRILIWAIPFVLLDLIIIIYGINILPHHIAPIKILDKWQSALLTLNVTIAVFAVNFSFAAYQFSAYRSLLGNLSKKHLLWATVTLIIALLPIVMIVLNDAWVPIVSLITIPIVSYSSIILSQIAIQESSPLKMIQKRVSKSCIQAFAKNFLKLLKSSNIEPPELDGNKNIGPPMHEMDWQPIDNIPHQNPFDFLRILSKNVIEQGDIENYDLIIDRALNAILELRNCFKDLSTDENWKQIHIIINYSILTIDMIGHLTEGQDKQIFAERFLNKIVAFIENINLETHESTTFITNILNCMLPVAKKQLEYDNYNSALIPIIFIRQWVTKQMNKKLDYNLIDYFFANCVKVIQTLGIKSIEKKNSEFHYRCLEALGWLGCTAAKLDNHVVGKQCANSLVQLGRTAHSKKLECFWSHCVLSPYDHALEHIEWIISWIVSLDENKRKRWENTLSEAISRLTGKTSEIIYTFNGTAPKYIIKTSDKNHIETINDNGRIRTIDYSNFNELKEFELY